MPRKPRFNEPGAAYHLISRFVAQEWFIRDSTERGMYLSLLGAALHMSDWSCLSYAVMSNHIHLVVVAGAQPLGAWAREAHRPFAEWTNQRRERIGPVFARGPKCLRIRDEAIADVIAYVHQNPVRAGLARDASSSSWTSQMAYRELARRPRWLDVERAAEVTRFRDASELADWIDATSIGRSKAREAHVALRQRRWPTEEGAYLDATFDGASVLVAQCSRVDQAARRDVTGNSP